MKNYSQYIFLAAFLLLVSACKDKDDKEVISTSKIKIGKVTVVTAVKDDKAVETNTDFFQSGDVIDFQYSINGSATKSFTVEKTSSSWDDASEALFYKDIYIDKKDPKSFTAEFGTKELTTDQSTSIKFHDAHYLKGDTYVKSSNANIFVDSMLNQHVLVIVKIMRSNSWPASPAFNTIVNENALVMHTSGESKVTPLYDGTKADRAVYSAVMPAGMVPAAGGNIFTLNDQPISYSFVGGGSAPVAGQTLVVTVLYNYGEALKATALTKGAWDATGDGKYGYPLIQEVANLEDLNAFAASVSSGVDYKDKTVTLKNNLDLNGETIDPIGIQDWPFNGTFLGQKYTIKNFVINNTSDNCALFGSVGVNGTIREITVENVSIETNASYAAGVAGSNYGYIVSCLVNGSDIIGGNYIGGVVGYNDGTIVGSRTFKSTINSIKKTEAIAGGISGFNYRNVISCKSDENKVQVLTRSENKFGLLIGENSNTGIINACSWSGNETVPAVGYSVKMPENSTTEQMTQAIKDYNKDKKEGDARYCSEAM